MKANHAAVCLVSIGQSYEGRDIWLATVTNRATGPAGEKPALWIDGNIHASEVSPSSACLYFIDWLKIEWVVVAPQGGAVKLLARHPRAGVVRAELSL